MSSTPLSELKPLQHTLRNAPNTSTFFRALIRELWNDDMTAKEYREEKRAYESYFAHIFQELSTITGGGDSIIRDLTFEHVFEIVQKLKSQNWTRAELIADSHPISGVFDIAHTQTTINFAAGLLVPLNFKSVGGARRGDVVSWLEGDTLSETISKRIEKITSRPCISPQACTSCNQSGFERYGKNFNARQLARIAGFEIIWTSNLVDHLLLQDEDDNVKVHIFHQLKVLENHLRFPDIIISQDLISETQDTIALLVPRTDRRVRSWYKNHQKHHILDPSVLSLKYLEPDRRRANHFRYWGERLKRLKRAFDDHEPNGPLQWWRDDRKPVQWWTFWIAALVLLLTVLFGFTQSITSILQVTKP